MTIRKRAQKERDKMIKERDNSENKDEITQKVEIR